MTPSIRKMLSIGCGLALVAMVAALIGLHRLGGPFYYSAEDIRGQIVDEATAQPVAGALVVATWELQTLGRSTEGILHAAEALTDERGFYLIRGFAPRLRPPLKWFTYFDPAILVFKPGYWLEGRNNHDAYIEGYVRAGSNARSRRVADSRILQGGPGYSAESRRFCYWNGKVIPFARKAASKEEQAQVLELFRIALPDDLARLPHSRRALARPPEGAPAPPMTEEQSRRKLLLEDNEPANDPPP